MNPQFVTTSLRPEILSLNSKILKAVKIIYIANNYIGFEIPTKL